MLPTCIAHACFAAFLGTLVLTAASPEPGSCRIERTGETTGSVTNRYRCAGPCSDGAPCEYDEDEIQMQLFRCFCNGMWPDGLSCRGTVRWKLDASGAPTDFVENCYELNCSGDCEPSPESSEALCRCDGV